MIHKRLILECRCDERLFYILLKVNMDLRHNKFIFSRIKKVEDQGKEKCHTKSMMSKEANESLKRDTHHVPLSQNTEEKVRGMGLKVVLDDVNV